MAAIRSIMCDLGFPLGLILLKNHINKLIYYYVSETGKGVLIKRACKKF